MKLWAFDSVYGNMSETFHLVSALFLLSLRQENLQSIVIVLDLTAFLAPSFVLPLM